MNSAVDRFAGWRRLWFAGLAAIVIGYALLGSLSPVSGDDPFFLLNDARWLVEHHEIPSVDHFSYTAQGQPWIYPVGGSLLFYGLWLIGGYALLSWFAASATAVTTALLLRNGSVISAVLTALAIPLIAVRTGVRADLFTTLLSAAYLALLWRYHKTSRARLWLLPVLMILWVNAHLGFFLGLGLIGGYILVEGLEFFWPDRRRAAAERLWRAGPWFVVTAAATVVNPFGLEIYGAVLRQLTAPQLEMMWEWQPVPINWRTLRLIGSPVSSEGAFVLVMLIAVAIAVVGVCRKQFGAGILLLGAVIATIQHIRSLALLAIVTVIVGSSVQDGIKMPIGQWGKPVVAAILAIVLTSLMITWARGSSPYSGAGCRANTRKAPSPSSKGSTSRRRSWRPGSAPTLPGASGQGTSTIGTPGRSRSAQRCWRNWVGWQRCRRRRRNGNRQLSNTTLMPFSACAVRSYRLRHRPDARRQSELTHQRLMSGAGKAENRLPHGACRPTPFLHTGGTSESWKSNPVAVVVAPEESAHPLGLRRE